MIFSVFSHLNCLYMEKIRCQETVGKTEKSCADHSKVSLTFPTDFNRIKRLFLAENVTNFALTGSVFVFKLKKSIVSASSKASRYEGNQSVQRIVSSLAT